MVMAASESLFHVLAVDDSIIDRKLIERLLKTSSYQVTTVDSGSKALEFLGLRDDEISHTSACPAANQSQEVVEVNLVITDYCMPGMTGYDLLKKIKESSSLRNIPVVIMSSENVPSRISRCLEEGAEEFFLKPVRLSDVNKLKPHMMKTKTKSHENSNPPDQKQDEQEQQVPSTADKPECESQEKPESETQEAAEADDQQCDNSMNKRKGVEESVSPNRTRSRYSSGLTAVSN